MANEDNSWRTPSFRQNIINKIDEAIQQAGKPTTRNSRVMETQIFEESKTREEYLSLVARYILHVREKGTGGGGSGGPQQANATTLLQTLNQRPSMQRLALGQNGQPLPGQMPGQMGNQINQMAGQMNPLGGQIGQMGGSMGPQMGNQIPRRMGGQMAGQMQNQLPGHMGGPLGNQMGGQMGAQMAGSMQNQIGGQMQGQLAAQLGGPMGGQMSGQMVGQMNNQMANQLNVQMNGQIQNQMQGQLPVQMNSQMSGQLGGQMGNQMAAQLGGPGNQIGGNQMPNQIPNQMNSQMSAQMLNQMNNHISGQMGGPMSGQMNGQMGNQMQGNISNSGPTQMMNQIGPQMGNQMNNQMHGQLQPSGGVGSQMTANMPMQNQMSSSLGAQIPNQIHNQIGGQLNSSIPGSLQGAMHMPQRKAPDGAMMGQNANFVGPRHVAPNQFLRQSPSPSVQSPASNQMASSPAVGLAPSPGSQLASVPGQQRSVGMALSPGSSINTPGQVQPNPSPLAQPSPEEQAYRDKIRHLSKYIEPLQRMIANMVERGGDGEKMSKMKFLLDLLLNPAKRTQIETLNKCEIVLDKLDFKRYNEQQPSPAPMGSLKDNVLFRPLLEAMSTTLQSPMANHTLQRTFGSVNQALFGSELKLLPPPKKKKIEDSTNDIPEILQGEIARLDQRFKVSLDQTQQTGANSIQLLCWLDDRHLPCVPPVSLTVPDDYPASPPRCVMGPHDYTATSFLIAVQAALDSRMKKLPVRFSVSQLLHTWEMAVRQASAPSNSQPSATAVLLGL